MSLNVVSLSNFKSASWSEDWTAQELAEFYRVEASLVRASIPIVTDRGRSDEGDPWFVFCNANTGEIIVHFARFDGTYVVASPALDNCARGRDFRALIEAQIASHPLVIPKPAGGGKLFIHPAALLIVLVATCFFKLSQTTAAAGELHEAQPAQHEAQPAHHEAQPAHQGAQPAHPGVGSLSHSDLESQAVVLDERATTAVLAAIVTGIAWAQSHDFKLWSIDAALPTKFDVPSQDLSVSTSPVASPFDAGEDNPFHAQNHAAARATPSTNIEGDPSTTPSGYRTLSDPNNHSAVGQAFTSFDASTPAATETPGESGPPTSAGSVSFHGYALQTEIMPISSSTVSGSTVSSGLSTTAPSGPTGDVNPSVAQFNSGAQTADQTQASLENAAPPTNTSVADFVLREFQAAWGVVPTARTTTSQYETWVARILADPALENGGMSQALADTPEFLTPYGLTSATEPASLAFVTQLCSNLFGVAPGPGALLNVGLPVWQVLQNFAQSSEFIADTSSAIVGFQSALLDGATPTGSIFQFGGTTATYALTTGNDTNASLGPSRFTASDLITGIINQTGVGPLLNASTLNPGDALVLGGGTLSITDLNHLAGNELAGVSLTGPFKFVVNEIAPTAGTFDFLTPSGATTVESLNSSQNVSFTDLAAGTNVEIGGAGTVSGTLVKTSYAASPAAVSYQIDGGVNGVTLEPSATSTNAPTSETILSTGAANGTAAHWDTFQATNSLGSVTQLTINATTGLVSELWNADFNATAGATSLTVLGAAALVDLTVGGTDAPFSIVDASGLTNGGLHIFASGDLTSFTGGGGGNELLWDGSALPAGATAIDGGGGTGNILSAQLVTSSNGNIFSNWQILDVTGLDAAFDARALVPTDPISGVQFHSGDLSAETVTNIVPAATVLVTGTGFTDAGLTITHSSGTGNSLEVMFNNTDTASALNDLLLTNLTSTGDGTVTIASTGAGSAASVGSNGIGTLAETDGVLATVTVTGNNYFYLGYDGGVSTDHATTSTADIASALHVIDASATTGGISINAGNTSLDASFSEVSYKGLVLDGGSGAGDFLYNGANTGVATDGNGKADAVWLGGSNSSGALGTGAWDTAEVGNSAYATAVTPVGPEAPGSALGDSVTFGAGATAEIIISGGAEWDGSTYVGNNANNGVGQTTVVGAVAAGGTSPGTLIDLGHIVGASTNIVNAQGVTAGASSLTAAENTAAAAVGGVGVAYFTYGSNEFLVAAHAQEGGVSVGDAVVALHGVGITGLSMAAGVVHLV